MPLSGRRSVALLVVATLGTLPACGADPAPATPAAEPLQTEPTPPTSTPSTERPALTPNFNPERLRAVVRTVYAHDPSAYTQGLLWHGGKVYESTGLRGHSTLRRWQLESGEIERRIDLEAELFGEGLARVGDKLFQLSWIAGRALIYDLESLELVAEHLYDGHGWGLCYDGKRLVMSDGTTEIHFRDPETFAELGRVNVTLAGQPLPSINELECVDGLVWANVYQTEVLVAIDPETGVVMKVVDASGLLTPAEHRRVDVLNGIAYRPETGTFLLTGKFWPKIFEVDFQPAG